jgi:hypothetical protein
VRTDIPPDLLLVPLAGTIHALMGTHGLQGRSTREASMTEVDRALDALAKLLAPPM